MRWMRFPISVALMAVWLMPGVLAGTLAVHLAFGHPAEAHHPHSDHLHEAYHPHSDHLHGEEDHPHPAGHHEAECRLGPGHHEDLASTLADIIHHGHQHEEADSADHEHDVRIPTPQLFEKPSFQVAAWIPQASPTLSQGDVVLAAPPAADPASSPPLFTANCTLLI